MDTKLKSIQDELASKIGNAQSATGSKLTIITDNVERLTDHVVQVQKDLGSQYGRILRRLGVSNQGVNTYNNQTQYLPGAVGQWSNAVSASEERLVNALDAKETRDKVSRTIEQTNIREEFRQLRREVDDIKDEVNIIKKEVIATKEEMKQEIRTEISEQFEGLESRLMETLLAYQVAQSK